MAIRKSLLPSAYQQVEYIEKDYHQYIDTGYSNTSTNQRIVCDFIEKSSGALFGSQYNQNRSGIYWSSGNNLRFGIGSQNASTVIGVAYQNVRHVVDYSSTSNTYSVKLDGTYVVQNASYSGSNITGINIYLFANNYNNTIEGQTNQFVLYSMQIYDNNVLVRNYIPCYRKSDSVIGLYDTVNGVFYTNAGSGTFTKGNDVMPKVKKLIKNNDYVIRAYKGSSLYYNALPSEFKAVEYIESSGLEYIDTGVIPTNNTEVDADFSVVNFNSNVVNYMFGNYETGKLFALYRNTSDIFGVMFSNYDNFSSYQIQLNTRYKAKLNSTGAYINGSSIKDFATLPDFTATNSLYIFKGNGSSRPPAILKLYGFTIKESNKVIRKLIPCYRVSDTEIGLYDLVNGVFYTNAGTGAFTKGSDI